MSPPPSPPTTQVAQGVSAIDLRTASSAALGAVCGASASGGAAVVSPACSAARQPLLAFTHAYVVGGGGGGVLELKGLCNVIACLSGAVIC